MGYSRTYWCVSLVGLFLVSVLLISVAAAQDAVEVMTMADGTKVMMTQAQFDALVTQPGIKYEQVVDMPQLKAGQMAIPVPLALGSRFIAGFIVGQPVAIAAGMNAVGITKAATTAGLLGATAAAGQIGKGATP